MKNIIILILFLPKIVLSQTQIGQEIYPELSYEQAGTSVSVSSNGQIVAVGASPANQNNTTTARARIYTLNGQSWVQKGQDLEVFNTNTSSYSTICRVSLSGNGNIVALSNPFHGATGSEGITKIFQYIENIWVQMGQDIVGIQDDYLGYNISLSEDGNTISVVSHGLDNGPAGNNGNVTIFQYDGSNWQQLGQIIEGYFNWDPYEKYSFYEASISLSNNGEKIAIGTPFSYSDTGNCQVRVYEYQNLNWIQLGQTLVGDVDNPNFGWDVSLSGNSNSIAIGSVNNDEPGRVKIYELNGNQWSQKGEDIIGIESSDFFGNSVSISDDGNILAVGAPNSNQYQEGSVKIFIYDGNNWYQAGTTINGANSNAFLGTDVALSQSGDFLVVASPNSSNYPYSDSGEVIVYGLSDMLSIKDYENKSIKIFPNPTKKYVNISLEKNDELIEVTIYNLLGQLIKKEKNTLIDISGLANGSYILQVITKSGNISEVIIRK